MTEYAVYLGLPAYQCRKCGYKWTPRKPSPIVCPNCKSRDWRRVASPARKSYKRSRR